MIVLGLLVMMTLLQVNTVRADGGNGAGYVGCYLGGSHWQGRLEDDVMSASVDDCVRHCSNRTYSAISVRTCYCSDALPIIQNSNDDSCNVSCFCNPSQMCGSSTHYSVYNTTTARLRNSANGSETSSDSPGFEPVRGTVPSGQMTDSHSCAPPGENQNGCRKEECCHCHPVWLRIVIDVAVIVGALSLIILIFVIVRCCRQRKRGMFDQWKPRTFRRRSQVEAGSHISGDDPLHRNHSYRNLSGSSTLDRGLGLESIEQVTGAPAMTAPARSLREDNVNKYGSLQTPAKDVSASTGNRRAATMNQHKPAKILQFTDAISLDDYVGQSCNRPAAPDPKNKPRQNTKNSGKKTPNDAANVKDNVLDKPKRRSLMNFLFKDSEAPSSQGPSKDAECAPKDSESFLNKTWGSRYGKKDTKRSETTEKRNSCSVSKDEAVFVNPKCNTLPNDIYAIPHKPAGRNKQAKERSASDTTKEATSDNVEHQDGYSGLSRLFKPRTSGKPKQGDDTTSQEEYSLLHQDLRDTDYDELKRQGGTGGHVGQEKIRGSDGKHDFIPSDVDAYASVDYTEYAPVGNDTGNDTEYAAVGNDTEYAEVGNDPGYTAVGEAAPGNSQGGDYEMVTQGQMK